MSSIAARSIPVAHFSEQVDQGRDGLGVVGPGEGQGGTQTDGGRWIDEEPAQGLSVLFEAALG